jgi:hypothetical protein
VLIPFPEVHEKLILGLQHVIPVGQFRPKHDVTPNDLMDRTINPLSILLGLEHMADTRFNVEFQKMIEKIRAYILGL